MPTKTQLRKGYKITFHTQNTENTVQLVHSVGEGGFGRVYKATISSSLGEAQQTIAVKFFLREKDCQQYPMAVSGSFLRELYALAAIQNRQIRKDVLEKTK